MPRFNSHYTVSDRSCQDRREAYDLHMMTLVLPEHSSSYLRMAGAILEIIDLMKKISLKTIQRIAFCKDN